MNTTFSQVTRNEKKYEIHLLDATNMQNELNLLLQRDFFSKNGSYMVRSLYFDSLNDIDFTEKYAGYEKRKKVRIRIYDSSALEGKFELKQKYGNYSNKKSLSITRDEIKRAMAGDYSFLLDYNTPISLELYSLLTLGCYYPKAIIEYQRFAFCYPENSTRITFDSNIKCSETNLNLFQHNLPWIPLINENLILEIKYNKALIRTVSDVLKKYKLYQVSVSKYTAGRPIFIHYIL
ncbi:MAG: polyphosphate polymerase domain-containing protein [Clostridium sp.]|nr:polyphosphate polymerase domain-containing protein [Clostridium sp.]